MQPRILIGCCVVVGALGYLAAAAMRSNWVYYQDVDSYAQSSTPVGTRARLYGKVSTADADIRPAELCAKFRLQGKTKSIDVLVHGPVPESLIDGAEVVVEGSLDQGGVFQADTLLTKCASKYEAIVRHDISHEGASPSRVEHAP